MSLDIYLRGESKKVECYCHCCNNKHEREDRELYYANNITHNLGEMAEEAGIYKLLWRPEEIGIFKAQQLITPLRDGLNLLQSNPKKFKQFNPKNGWGNYDNFISFVEEYLKVCEKFPNANIKVSR